MRVGDLTIAYLAVGPVDGPLALCLHGFPDHAFTWQALLPRLGDNGWRAVAPWLRGYHPTGQPAEGCMQPGALAADAAALHEVLAPRAGTRARPGAIVGHDWGAVAAYGAASAAPWRWSTVVSLAVPPRPAWLPAALTDPTQWRRSSYIFFFQLPRLPERALSAGNFRVLDRLWQRWWNGYEKDLDFRSRLLATFAERDTLSAALGVYRSLFNPWRRDARYRHYERALLAAPDQPTLYMHGADDDVIGTDYARRTRRVLGRGSQVAIAADTGHFLHLQRPDAVNGAIVDFLGTP